MLLLLQYTPPSVAPVISGLNSGTNALVHGQACTITGLQFTGVAGTITLVQGSLSQVQSTGVTWADTSIAFTANATIFANGPIVLQVTNANGTAERNVTLNPVAGKAYINADVPWPVGAFSVFEGAAPAVVDNDQLEYDLVTNNAGNVTMFADGTFTIDDDTQGHTFNVRVFDRTDSTWSATALITVNWAPTVTISGPVDTDGRIVRGQVGTTIPGTNFSTTQGTVTVGGVAQTVQTWANTAITFIVAAGTPLGVQTLTVTNIYGTVSASVVVALTEGQSPIFVGPSISVATLTQNTAMAAVAVAARFADPVGQTLTFSAVGAWPAGVTVTSTSGSIQGLPTIPGTYTGLGVRATNSNGLFVDSNTFTITVQGVVITAPVFVGPSISIASLTQNAAMTAVDVSSRFSDAQALTFSAVNPMPAGITVSSAGVISGTPTASGTFNNLLVRATDPDGNSVTSNTFTITVASDTTGPPVITPTPTPQPGSGAGISDISIVNLALTKLGEARIISFGDDTKAARTMTALYEITRDAELRRRKWRFSLKRAALPALTSSPEFGYAYAYQLPSDCLSILSVGDVAPGVDMSDYRTGIDMGLYSLEGRQILTDMGAPLNLRYKARISDPSQFDIAFVAALASRLAYEAAEDLTQSAAKRQQAGEDYKVALREAVAANAIEVAPEPMADNSWLLSRQ